MPLPALLGLPAVVAWFGTVAGTILAWIFTTISKRAVILMAALTAMSLTVMSIYDIFRVYIASLIVSAPPELVSASFLMPSNTSTCVGLILSAEATCAIYSISMRLIRLKVEAVS